MKRNSTIIPLLHADGSSEDTVVEWWQEDQKCWIRIQLADREFLESADRFLDAIGKAKKPLEIDKSTFEQKKYLNLLFNWEQRSTELPLLHPNGTKSLAQVQWRQKALKHGWYCHVSIKGAGLRSKGKRGDFFDALEEARLPFEQAGFRLLCYGASLNVFPSGMARDWGLGKEAYQLEKDTGTKEIFMTGKDVIPATVKEQRLFYLNWRDGDRGREIQYDDSAFQWQIEPYLNALSF